MRNKFLMLLILVIIAFVLRITNLTFPVFTSEEARVAHRGSTLATFGKDELGRSFPVLFNSLEDYQLPVVSYLTAGGELLFGKSELGARMPFIILGVTLVLVTFQIAKFFSQSFLFWFTSASVVAFSPPLIFLSKVPTEAIVLVFLFALLFYLLVSKKSILLVMLVMILSLLTSKQAWFILFPFTFLTLMIFRRSFTRNRKLLFAGLSVVLVLVTVILFLTIPQSKRSMVENNFSLFSSSTINNGINQLRGEGMKQDWPPLVGRLLFNKGHFLTTGLLHWLSNISLSTYFGQFDGSGKMNYSYIGALPKILLIPFGLGLISLIRGVNRKNKLLLPYFLILTFPAIFIYPGFSLSLIVLTLPFMALLISMGIECLSRRIVLLIFILMIAEVSMNIFWLKSEFKNTTELRPAWTKELIGDIFEKSKVSQIAVSDDFVIDITPYIQWYSLANPKAGSEVIPYPYKFRQYSLENIKIIGSDEKFTTCDKSEKLEVFASNRDLDKIRNQLKAKIISIYKDSQGEEKVYLTEGACIK